MLLSKTIFSKYPQIVNISGHTHGSLADERAIWQGAFTSLNAGCLQNWGDGRDGIAGSSVPRINNYGVVVLDVFADRLVFRRFDVRDGEEYHAESPWTFVLRNAEPMQNAFGRIRIERL